MATNEVTQRFEFHKADDITGPRHDEIRLEFKAVAAFIDETLPDCREKALALTALQESMMWCNAAVAYRR
jgi:hypothetical protein